MTQIPPPAEHPWHLDPIEIDRFLDGELSAGEAAARAEDLARNPELSRRVALRKAFLERLGRSGAAWQVAVRTDVPDGLVDRVHGALSRRRTLRLPRVFAYAAAAVVLLALGSFFLPEEKQEQADAAPAGVLLARHALEASMPQEGGCAEGGPASPFAFPPVQEGELDVVGCDEAAHAPGLRPAVLRGQEQIIGFVAVPEPGTRKSPKVGKTLLGDVVVYDVQYGDSRAYLAVPQRFVEKRGDCAACHNRSRDGQKNPHYIELRRWVVK